jgi:hypothetical protein
VTIHGIGFQEPPSDGVAGYADDLHANLAAQVPELSDDPRRQPWQNAATVPIYVHSRFPADGGTRDDGLARLGRWSGETGSAIITDDADLFAGGATVAHVALVYAELEDLGPQPAASAEALVQLVAEHRHYGSVLSSLHTVLSDATTALFPPHHDDSGGGGALRPRTDAGVSRRHVARLWPHKGKEDAGEPPGIAGTVRQLEDDVCGYICRNDLRERIRWFVREALLRLAARRDLGSIVVNSHSNGTVISFDAIRDLPAAAAQRVRLLVTAGSPLRKYAELFTWGHEVGNVRQVGEWINFFDPRDPVADPLAHPVGWTEGRSFDPAGYTPFASWPPDTETAGTFPITDRQVDNVHLSSGGGLQAHNYWDNKTQFISALAAGLRTGRIN